MRTKEQTEAIATLAKTTPEIVEAVLSAYYKVRYVPIQPRPTNKAINADPKAARPLKMRGNQTK